MQDAMHYSYTRAFVITTTLLSTKLDMNKNFKSLYRGMRNVIQKATFNSILLAIPPVDELNELVSLAKQSIHGIEGSIDLRKKEIQILE